MTNRREVISKRATMAIVVRVEAGVNRFSWMGRREARLDVGVPRGTSPRPYFAPMLPEHNQGAPQALEQRIRGVVRQRYDGRQGSCRIRVCKPEYLAARFQESLEREKRFRLDPECAN